MYSGDAYHNLVQEVLDELFLEGSRREQSVEIGAKKLCNEVAVDGRVSLCKRAYWALQITYISSRGEMKMSLREITLEKSARAMGPGQFSLH